MLARIGKEAFSFCLRPFGKLPVGFIPRCGDKLDFQPADHVTSFCEVPESSNVVPFLRRVFIRVAKRVVRKSTFSGSAQHEDKSKEAVVDLPTRSALPTKTPLESCLDRLASLHLLMSVGSFPLRLLTVQEGTVKNPGSITMRTFLCLTFWWKFVPRR